MYCRGGIETPAYTDIPVQPRFMLCLIRWDIHGRGTYSIHTPRELLVSTVMSIQRYRLLVESRLNS